MKKRPLFALLVLLLGIGLVTFGLPDEAQAATTGKIRGKITDASTNEALAGVVVVMEDLGVGVTTDEDGDYTIINLPPGLHDVKASMIGYGELTKTRVSVSIDRTTTVDFRLSAAAIGMEQVTVEAVREVVPMDVSGSQAVVSGDEMATSVSKNVVEALSLEPSVYQGQVRGGGTDETLFLMDGMRLVDERLNEAYMGVNATAIQEVQINTGGFNAEYGNLRSGLFNVVTREGKPGEISLFLNYRFSPAGRKHFGSDAYGTDTWEWQVYGQSSRLGRVWDDAGQIVYEGTAAADGSIPLLDQQGNTVRTVAADAVPTDLLWKGWNQIAADQAGQAGAKTAQEAQALWKWRHRGYDYADKADQNLDATVIGTVPGLPSLKFLVSHRLEYSQFAMPQPRDGYSDRNTQIKLDFTGLENWKITGSALLGTIESMGTAGRAWAEFGSAAYADAQLMRDIRPSYLSYSTGTTPSGGWQETDALYYGSIGAPLNKYNPVGSLADRDFAQLGLTVKNILSASTYWDASIQRFSGDYGLGPSAARNTELVARNIDGVTIMADEGPAGVYPAYASDQTGLYLMDSEPGGRDSSSVSTVVLSGNITSQMNKFNQAKAGIEFVFNDIDEQSGQIVVYRSEAQFKDAEFSPWRFAAYLQDKLEIEGMIANVGLRAEYLNPNVKRFFPNPEEDFFGEYADLPSWYGDRAGDPRNWSYADWFEQWEKTGEVVNAAGEVQADFPAPTARDAKTRWKFSPRLGVSFPVSDAAKVYFNYGHFYTMPRTRHMYGFFGASGRQFFNWMGNPDLEWAQTIAYELGYDHNIANTYHLHLAGYVKDGKNMPDFSMYFPSTRTSAPTGISSAKLYYDIRGFEAKVNKRVGRYLTGWVNFDYVIQSRGLVGFAQFQQDPRELDIRSTTDQRKPDPIPSARASVDLHSPQGWGAEIAGYHPLENLSVNWLQWWSKGAKATWDPALTGQVYNNVQWKDILNTDVRISKTFKVGDVRPVLYVDIANLFNRRLINPAAFLAEDWNAYMESLNFESEGKGGGDRIGDWDKGYIALPERDRWAAFINPRDIFIGVNFSMDISVR